MKHIVLWLSVFAALHAVSQPSVPKKKFQLFLLAGQSNMAGRGVVEPADQQTDPRIWVLNKSNEWQLAAEPLHFDKPGITGVGPGLAFAKRMLQLDSNLVIGLVPCAVGGSPIEVWQAGKYYEPVKCHPYDDAVKRIQIAGKLGTFKGILWHQGESDAHSARSALYGQRLKTLIGDFRKELRNRKLPFVAGSLAAFYVDKHPYGNRINATIDSLSKRLKNLAVVSAAGLSPNADQVHFNTASARELGKRFADVFYAKFGKKAWGRSNNTN